MTRSRREFLKYGGATGIGLLTFTVAGCEKQLTPGEARRQDVPLQVLTRSQAGTLDALGSRLVPGSADAGLSHYIDHQLAGGAGDSMLMIRYLGVAQPYLPFYLDGLAAVERVAAERHDRQFPDLGAGEADELVADMAAGKLPSWDGPPAGLFYFVLRSDAVDVVYGTPQGFESLGIPYMAHIVPPSRWGE